MGSRFASWWHAVRHRSQFERDLAEELATHVALRADDLRRQGLPPSEADRQARLELGSRERYREEARAATGLGRIDELVQDVRYTLRTLRRSPGFTVVALTSVALGVGTNTVVSSIMTALVLRPPAIRSPESVQYLQSSNGPPISYPNYRDLRDQNGTFTGMAAYRFAPMGLETPSGAFRVWGYLATGNYFDVLGIRPALGRFFTPEEDRVAGANRIAVLTHAMWKNRFAGDSSVIGRVVRLNAHPYTIIGVAEPGFAGVELVLRAELWVPMTQQPEIEGSSWLEERETYNSMVVGRLRPGVTVGRAEADLNTILRRLANDFPAANAGLSIHLVKPGLMGDSGRRPMTAFATGVMALSLMVLLAACMNLAGLLIARTADRSREIALRLSIGAGRGRVLRQLVTESVVLTLAGGTIGWAVAEVVLRRLSNWQPIKSVPLQLDVTPDYRVLLVATGATVLIGIWCGLAAGRQARRVELAASLRGAPSRGTPRPWNPRDLVVAIQMAVAFVLVTASVASIRGLERAFNLPFGLRPVGLVGAAVDLGLSPRTAAEGRTFLRRALDVVSRLPGVDTAAYANTLPLTADQSNMAVFSEREATFEASHAMNVSAYAVSPGYFATVGTEIRAGREFTWHDDEPSHPIAIVNETLAKRLLGGTDVVGRHFRLDRAAQPVEIVGVVEDGKYQSLSEDPRPAIFRPAMQSHDRVSVLVVRTAVPAAEMAGSLRRAITEVDPAVPIFSVGAFDELAGFAFIPARVATAALTTFGLLALVLAVAGIYGMAAYAVSRRIREIGVRVALGAKPGQVLWVVFRRAGLLLGLGSGVGFGVALAFARILEAVVYQASARDPLVLGLTVSTLLVAGIGATIQPAHRALSVDPLRAIRSD
jgi:predicted permease